MVKNRLIKDCVINNTPIGTRNPRTGRFTNCIFESYIKIGELTITNVDGSSGQVLSTDGNGTLSWANNAGGGGASNLNDLSDVLIENESIWLGGDPSGTTNNAFYNTSLGINSLNQITTGAGNTAIGHESLKNCTIGSANTAIGAQSLFSLTEGNFNVGIGVHSLFSLTSGYENIGIGHESLFHISTGYGNTGIGIKTLKSCTTGFNNTCIGLYSGESISTAVGNVSVGAGALQSCTTGNNNICIGLVSCEDLTIGTDNISIGDDTHTSTIDSQNEIIIGHRITGHGTNIAVIGGVQCSAWHPNNNNQVDLGSITYQFKDLYFNGNINNNNYTIEHKSGTEIMAFDGSTAGSDTFTITLYDKTIYTAAKVMVILKRHDNAKHMRQFMVIDDGNTVALTDYLEGGDVHVPNNESFLTISSSATIDSNNVILTLTIDGEPTGEYKWQLISQLIKNFE